MRDGKTIAQRIRGYCDVSADGHYYPTTIAGRAEMYSLDTIGEVGMLRAWADEIEAEIEEARQMPKWYEYFQDYAAEELERPILGGESIKAWIERNYIERPRPDTQERILVDARKIYIEYWGCENILCDDCPAKVDGKTPKEHYGTHSCDRAQALDLLRRQRELDGAGERL